jgi:universal stress protein E
MPKLKPEFTKQATMRKFPIRRILVAVKNLESRSIPAVAKAAQLARAYGADVELFHSVEVPLYLDPYAVVSRRPQQLQQLLQRQASRRLERLAGRLQQQGVHATVSVECDSPAYDAIVRRALHTETDLIVASHHAGEQRAPWLRLTDWELVRLSPLPVLLVKNSRAYRRPRLLMAVDPTHAFAKPARLDRSILDVGTSLSNALHGTLYAVHAFPFIPLEILAPGAKAPVVTQDALKRAQQRAERSAKAHMEALLRDSGIAASRRYVIAAHPIDAIEAAVRRSRSAIVVMGAVSRSGLKRLLIGNTAERILDALTCDVLVVKPQGFRSRVPKAARAPLSINPVASF